MERDPLIYTELAKTIAKLTKKTKFWTRISRLPSSCSATFHTC